MPKFSNSLVWQQAEALMQPAFIRLVANIGKRLEQSTWRGEYQDIQVWPEGTHADIKARVLALQHQLTSAEAAGNAAQIQALQAELQTLPAPYPGYQLCLSQEHHQVCVDLWDLCYMACFRDYDAETGTSRPRGFGQAASQSVEIDSSLFEAGGEVDWDRLDAKVKHLVDQIFTNLPA